MDTAKDVLQDLRAALTRARNALRQRDRELKRYEKAAGALERLREAIGGEVKRSRRGTNKPARKARRKISAKTRALRKAQGRYMGLVRPLKAKSKARVKKVLKEKGLKPAIKAAVSELKQQQAASAVN